MFLLLNILNTPHHVPLLDKYFLNRPHNARLLDKYILNTPYNVFISAFIIHRFQHMSRVPLMYLMVTVPNHIHICYMP